MPVCRCHASEPTCPALRDMSSHCAAQTRRHLSDTNTTLDDHTLLHARESAQKSEVELTSLQEHIWDLRAELGRLTKQVYRYEQCLHDQKAAISAIRRFPAELICRIMLLALGIPNPEDDEPSEPRLRVIPYDVSDCDLGPWPLSQVCRSWRNVALGFPRMWSCVRVRFRKNFSPPPLELLQAYLNRSGSYRLHVTLIIGPATVDWKRTKQLRLLLSSSHRWHSARIHINASQFSCLRPLKGKLSQLQSFNLVFGGGGDPPPHLSGLFKCTPSLRFLDIDFAGVPADIGYAFESFSDLRHLSLGMYHTYYGWPSCTRLTSLTLTDSFWLRTEVELPALRRLDLRYYGGGFDEAQSLLYFSNLKRLEWLGVGICDGMDILPMLSAAVNGSGCAVKDLSIHYTTRYGAENPWKNGAHVKLPHFFQSCPDVERLQFYVTSYATRAHIAELSSLHLPCIFSVVNFGRHPQLPRLKRFEILAKFPEPGDGGELGEIETDRTVIHAPSELFEFVLSRGHSMSTSNGAQGQDPEQLSSSFENESQPRRMPSIPLECFFWKSNFDLSLSEYSRQSVNRLKEVGLGFERVRISDEEAGRPNPDWLRYRPGEKKLNYRFDPDDF
jgi:hypothetical protein